MRVNAPMLNIEARDPALLLKLYKDFIKTCKFIESNMSTQKQTSLQIP